MQSVQHLPPLRVLVLVAVQHQALLGLDRAAAREATEKMEAESTSLVEVHDAPEAATAARLFLERQLDEDAVVVSQDWLVTGLDGVGVFVEDEGLARWRPVETGQIVGRQVEIISGLADGGRVVTAGHRDLADGDRVRVTRAVEAVAEVLP